MARTSTPRPSSKGTAKSGGGSGSSGARIRLPARTASVGVSPEPSPVRPKPKRKPVVETPAIEVEEIPDSDVAESDELEEKKPVILQAKKRKTKGKGKPDPAPVEVADTPPPPPIYPEIIDPSLRTILLTRTLVPHASPPRDISLSDLEANERELRTGVDRLKARMKSVSSPSWRPAPIAPIPVYVRPTVGPSPNYDDVPAEIPKFSKPQPPEPDLYASADERLLAQRADYEWHQEAMEHSSRRMLRIQEIQEAKLKAENKVRPFWADVDRKEAEYKRLKAERDERVEFLAGEPARVRTDLENFLADYEDVRGRIAEHRSRIAQAADAKRGLDSLAAQMRNLASVARSLDPDIEMTEYVSLLLDCLHLGNPPDDLKYVPAEIPVELVVAATSALDQSVPVKGNKRTRAEAAGLAFVHLVPHGSVPDGITEEDVAIFDAILSKKESAFRSALLPFCDRKLVLAEGCARCARLFPCLAVVPEKPRKLNARTMTLTCVSCQSLHVSCGTVGCDYFPGTRRFIRIWNHRVGLGEHPMPEAVLQSLPWLYHFAFTVGCSQGLRLQKTSTQPGAWLALYYRLFHLLNVAHQSRVIAQLSSMILGSFGVSC
ncbi:hypothetical protein DFH06DRAFT_1315582 [Mycena polygramma]|nr:hypothetical protein DFH06DRAFT_1315582 [Mycena polygramma]